MIQKITDRWWAFYHTLWAYKPRFLWQRATRGYTDYDLWSLDSTISEFVAPRMRAFAEGTILGCPFDFHEKYGEAGHFMWRHACRKMAFAFEKLAEEDRDWLDGYDYFRKLDYKNFKLAKGQEAKRDIWMKVTEARWAFVRRELENFGKYYLNLWD